MFRLECNRLNHGCDRRRCELLDRPASLAEDADLVLSLDDLPTRLGPEDLAAARLAKLRLFGGPSVEGAGADLGMSLLVVYWNWEYARLAPRRPREIIRDPRDAFPPDGALWVGREPEDRHAR